MLTNRFQSLRFIEEALYQSAPSLAKYKDSDTLEERLREKEFVLALDSQQRGTKHDIKDSPIHIVRSVPHRSYKLPEKETNRLVNYAMQTNSVCQVSIKTNYGST